MKLNKIHLIASITINIAIIQINPSNLNLKSQTSTIELLSGTNFIIENEITDYHGTLIMESGSTIEGKNIIFNNGVLENFNNKINLSGTLTPNAINKIYLNGNTKLINEIGNILQNIEVSRFNNYIEGSVFCQNNITLQDINSSLTVNILNELPVNVLLNNGMLFLDKNLRFKDNKKIIGPGKVFLNNYTLDFGSKNLTFNKPLIFDSATDIKLCSNITLNELWTFSGSHNILFAQNNSIYLESSGALVVDAGSTLTIKDATISGVGNSNIRCSTQDGKIFFNNVTLFPSANITFSSGSFEITGNLEINGSYTFDYQSTQQSTIKKNSSLLLDNNSTFYYHPNSANNDLLSFEDETSSLIIKNSTLHITTTDLKLTKGNLIITENSYLSSDEIGQIIFGNNNTNDDFYCNFLNASCLNLIKGKLVYQNINSSAWKMPEMNTSLNIHSNATLNLKQNLDLQEGQANFYSNSILLTAPNKYLFGAVSNINEYK